LAGILGCEKHEMQFMNSVYDLCGADKRVLVYEILEYPINAYLLLENTLKNDILHGEKIGCFSSLYA